MFVQLGTQAKDLDFFCLTNFVVDDKSHGANARAGMVTVWGGRLGLTVQCQTGYYELRRDFVWVRNLQAFSRARMWSFIVAASEYYLLSVLIHRKKTGSYTIKNDDDGDDDKNNIY